MSTRVKICGITNVRDAFAAAEAGADALGFIFFERSARHISVDSAARIIASLPPFVTPVGVFVDASAEKIQRIVADSGIRVVQLHGDEPPALCDEIRVPVVKAFRVRDQSSLDTLREYNASALLLDSYVPGQAGGTGAKFNWELALHAKSFGKPIILAGGLTPDNVSDAVAKVGPYAVDVSSGVESLPGRKDSSKLRMFIARARSTSADRVKKGGGDS